MVLDPSLGSHEALTKGFQWPLPPRFNIGVAVCDRWALDPTRTQAPALIVEGTDGAVQVTTFAALKVESDRMANVLAGLGVARGDRVALLLPQRRETAAAHVAIYKSGAIAVPLFTLFGQDALTYRLGDCGASVVLTDGANAARLMEAIAPLSPRPQVVVVDPGGPAGTHDLATLMTRASGVFTPVDTGPDDPALIIYTSGTTGKPKGALHAHRVLLGHLPGVEMPHDFFPREGDLFWTPADWAWIGGLLDVLLPSLFHGVPVLAHRAAKFDPEAALDLMARHRVRNVFMPPTALRMIRQLPDTRVAGRVALRTVGSGGETLGRDLLDWGETVLGAPINEFYGQTECNLVVANNAALFPIRPGAMGKAVPGHRVAIIGEDGQEKADGDLGLVAVARPDPVMFLEYWNNPEATQGKFIGDWLVTGDMGHRDPEGYLWFKGRDDDVITSAGYRIGPGEVEDVLSTHPAVRQVAVVGVPDPERTEIVKAFIVPKDPAVLDDPDAAARLTREIQDFAKARHAAHAYPRSIAFLEALPTTATGKIRRKDLRDLPS
jgi:acetyl-CoA synthetase